MIRLCLALSIVAFFVLYYFSFIFLFKDKIMCIFFE